MRSMVKRIAVWLVALTAVTGSAARAQDTSTGAALYGQYCALCHEQSARTRAPERESLKQRTPESIYDALRSGNMASTMQLGQAALSDGQKFASALGYAPLPAEVVKLELAALAKVKTT